MQPRSGFTLIEMSIVIVIIGLIAGGILLGRHMFEAAMLRSQITQIERYNTAANTFRTKYGYLPGDILADQAASLGFAARTGDFGNGDGNGYVNGKYDPWFGFPSLGGETVFFWTDLSAALMIDGSFTYSTDDGITATPNQMTLYLPKAKISRGYVMIYGHGERQAVGIPGSLENNYQLVEFNLSWSGATFGLVGVFGGPFTPTQAIAFDQKIDDGLPAVGTVQLMMGRAASTSPVNLDVSVQIQLEQFGSLIPPADDCAVNSPPLTYTASNPAKANLAFCSLRIKAAF